MKPAAKFAVVLVTALDLKIAHGVASSLWLDLIGAQRRHYNQIRTVVSAVGAKSL
jgi:hypothetical protein